MSFILGLTGSIAMGKSTASSFFRVFGLPVFDADAAVHRLFFPGGEAVGPVLQAFPGTANDAGGIDRKILGQLVFDDPLALRRLERIVHPLVRHVQQRFLAANAKDHVPAVVMDIPLLYETGGERLMDAVAVVSAPAFLQAQRVLRRPGMTRERLAAILARQMPDREKRRRADFVIPTGLGKRVSLEVIGSIVDDINGRQPSVWPDRWRRSAQK